MSGYRQTLAGRSRVSTGRGWPPVVLVIGGLDPSGGAGILADMRALGEAGAWGCAACAALTVQSTRGLVAVEPVRPVLLTAQIEELLADVPVGAIKTGALGSSANARAVAPLLARLVAVPKVVDPVMWPSRGRANLAGRGSVQAIRRLVATATVVAPNVPEAEALLGARIETASQAREAARALLDLGPRAVLLKGGHLSGARVSDWLATRGSMVQLTRARVPLAQGVHGTGCTLAALLAGRLACTGALADVDERALEAAVRWALRHLSTQLRRPLCIGGGMPVLAPRRRGTDGCAVGQARRARAAHASNFR